MNDFEVAELHEQVQRLEAQVQYLIEAMLGEKCCVAPAKEESPAEEAEDETAADEEE